MKMSVQFTEEYQRRMQAHSPTNCTCDPPICDPERMAELEAMLKAISNRRRASPGGSSRSTASIPGLTAAERYVADQMGIDHERIKQFKQRQEAK